MDMVCKPWEKELESQVQDWIDQTPLVNTWATLINSYWPVLVTACTGVVMSYVYITLLRFRAQVLVQTGSGLCTNTIGHSGSKRSIDFCLYMSIPRFCRLCPVFLASFLTPFFGRHDHSGSGSLSHRGLLSLVLEAGWPVLGQYGRQVRSMENVRNGHCFVAFKGSKFMAPQVFAW